MGDVDCCTTEDWNYILDVNLHGVINGVQAVYNVMVKQGFGHIVNTASFAGIASCHIGVHASGVLVQVIRSHHG